MWFWIAMAVAAFFLGVHIVYGSPPRSDRRTAAKPDHPGQDDWQPPAEPELWTAEAVAKLGTEETVADLVAQGRTDELRGLGYQGDLPKD